MLGNPSNSSLVDSQYVPKWRLVHAASGGVKYEQVFQQRYHSIQFEENFVISCLRFLHLSILVRELFIRLRNVFKQVIDTVHAATCELSNLILRNLGKAELKNQQVSQEFRSRVLRRRCILFRQVIPP
jgi:hypothetical protein